MGFLSHIFYFDIQIIIFATLIGLYLFWRMRPITGSANVLDVVPCPFEVTMWPSHDFTGNRQSQLTRKKIKFQNYPKVSYYTGYYSHVPQNAQSFFSKTVHSGTPYFQRIFLSLFIKIFYMKNPRLIFVWYTWFWYQSKAQNLGFHNPAVRRNTGYTVKLMVHLITLGRYFWEKKVDY